MTPTAQQSKHTDAAGRLRGYNAVVESASPFAVSAVVLVVYILLEAKALNLDGLGYAGRVESGDPEQLLLPGHLLYGPIMYALWRVASIFVPGVEAALCMQVCDSVFAAAGVGVFILALRRLSVSGFTAVAAGLALASTYTYWVHGTDLTTYAFSTFCLICAFHMLCSARSGSGRLRLWPIGAMVALATLIHQSNLVFLPAAMLGVYGIAGGRLGNAFKLAVISLVLICIPYALLGGVATGSRSPAAVARWAMLGAHGYVPVFEPVNLARGVYGFANAVVYLDDAGTVIKGGAARIAGSQLSIGEMMRFASKAGFVVMLVGIPSAAIGCRRRLSDDARWAAGVCVAWIVPYAFVALVFFTTDHDRWIMLLPAVVTLAAVAYPRPTTRGKIAATAAIAVLCCLNLSSAIYPAHLGISNRYYQEAIRLAPSLAAGDLVVFWGHNHIGTSGYLRQLQPVEAVHVVDMSLKVGRAKALRSLTRMVSSAIISGRRVFVIGFYDTNDLASDYLSEAHALGLTRADVARALSPFAARRAFTSGPDAAYQLAPKTPPMLQRARGGEGLGNG